MTNEHPTEEAKTKGQSLDLRDLHAANIARQAEWCPDQVPDLSFRGNELGGECGEAQNVIKKLERERQGWRGSRATKDDLADELADVVICADLCAVTAGIDLGGAVLRKFNATSEKQGLSVFLPAAPASAAPRADSADRVAGEARRWVVPRAVLVEAVAQHFHDEEHGHEGYAWTWPEYADDDGRRGNSGYVSITPQVVQMECREAAERLVRLFEGYVATPAPSSPGVTDSVRALAMDRKPLPAFAPSLGPGNTLHVCGKRRPLGRDHNNAGRTLMWLNAKNWATGVMIENGLTRSEADAVWGRWFETAIWPAPDSTRTGQVETAALAGLEIHLTGPALCGPDAAKAALEWVNTNLSTHTTKQSEQPILRATVDVFADRTDTRLAFGDRTAPDPGVKAVQQAIAALTAEYEARGGCPVVGRHPAGQSTGQGADGWTPETEWPKVVAEYVQLAFANHPVRPGFWDGETWITIGCVTECGEYPIQVRALDKPNKAALRNPFKHAPDSTRTGQVETEENGWRIVRAVMRRLSAAKNAGGIEDPETSAQVLGAAVDAGVIMCREALAARPAAPEAQGAWSFDMEAAPRDGYRVPVAILSWIDRKPVAGEAAFSNENQQWRWTDESYRDPIQPYAWFRMPEPPAPPASSGQESAR